MAQPADPQSVLDAIKEIHDEAEQISGCADSPQAKGSRQLHTDGPSVRAPITTRDDDSALCALPFDGDVKRKAQARKARPIVAMRRQGTEPLVVVLKPL